MRCEFLTLFQCVSSAQIILVGSRDSLHTRFTLLTPTHKDYPVSIWAVHKLGGIITYVIMFATLRTHLSILPRPCNPTYTGEELVHQLQITKAKLIITHSISLQTVLSAALKMGIPNGRIVVLDSPTNSVSRAHSTISDLVAEGLTYESHFFERRLAPGEGKTKVAFLSFSSGTTSKPKVSNRYSIVRCI
jgi:acyl-CoA synthetase (AMP-forming)/AMP-acid ligase II